MVKNRWLGDARPVVAKQVLRPSNVTPGSVWTLRVGGVRVSYTYSASIENTEAVVSDNDRAQVVVDGLVAAYDNGGSFGGGTSGTLVTIRSDLYLGRWVILAIGPSNGGPVDVELTVSDPVSAEISVVSLQSGRVSRNAIQNIKFPAVPTGGHWNLRFKNDSVNKTSLYDFNAPNADITLGAAWTYSVGQLWCVINPTDPRTSARTNIDFNKSVDSIVTLNAINITGGQLSQGAFNSLYKLVVYVDSVQVAQKTADGPPTLTFNVPKGAHTIALELKDASGQGTGNPVALSINSMNVLELGLPYNATAAEVQSAMRELDSIGAGNVNVTGSYINGFTVEFVGALAGTEVPLLDAHSEDFIGTAAYAIDVEKIGGVGRQKYVVSDLGGDSAALFKFNYVVGEDSGESHFFTGASSASLILAAIESIPAIGVGNATVMELAGGGFEITLIGALIGREGGTLAVVCHAGDVSVTVESSAPEFVAAQTVVTITILNMPTPYVGYINFEYDGNSTENEFFNGAIRQGIELNGINPSIVSQQLVAAGITAWACTEITGGVYGAMVLKFTAYEGKYDSGVILADVSKMVGCNAIGVRTTQLAQTPRSEVQQVNIESNPSGGTFSLSFGSNTASNIAFNASAATVQTAMRAIASIGAGNLDVAGPIGGPFICAFRGALSAMPLSLISGNATGLTLPTLASVTSTTAVQPSGPNWWTAKGNWSLGRVPQNDDVAIFESGNVSCEFGIDGVPAFAGLRHYRTFTGNIGLTETLDDGSRQTLPQYLRLTDNMSVMSIELGLGHLGEGSPAIRIDTGLQDAIISAPYSAAPPSGSLYTYGLAGKILELSVGNAAVGVAMGDTLTATVEKILVSSPDSSVVLLWGSGAAVVHCESYRASVQTGSVPSHLVLTDGEAIIEGVEMLSTAVLQGSVLHYRASGLVGQQGAIESIAIVADRVVVTSTAHGLASGNSVFVRDLFGVTETYFSVLVENANSFTLQGTDAAWLNASGVYEFVYGDDTVVGAPRWGLSDAVRVGFGSTLDFSEVSVVRTVVAPVLLQSKESLLLDPLMTISDLRWRCDPGFLTEGFGRSGVYHRENEIGNMGGFGGSLFGLAIVATTGLYSDLIGAPVLSTFATTDDLQAVIDSLALKANLVGGEVPLSELPDLGSGGGPWATFAQGELADSAVQPGDLSSVATTGAYGDLSGRPTLGSAASQSSSVFASHASVVALVALLDSKADLVNGEVPLSQLPDLGSGGGPWATVQQGELADSAVQPSDLTAVATSGAYADLSGRPTLGTAAAQASGAFATAAQGAKADSAVQPGSDAALATVTVGAFRMSDAARQSSASVTYTLQNADNGRQLEFTAAGSVTIIVPVNLTANFSCSFMQCGAGQLEVVPVSGAVAVTNRSSQFKTAGQWAVITLLPRGANLYTLAGDTAA